MENVHRCFSSNRMIGMDRVDGFNCPGINRVIFAHQADEFKRKITV